jgi:hypothetical protein
MPISACVKDPANFDACNFSGGSAVVTTNQAEAEPLARRWRNPGNEPLSSSGFINE